MYLKRLLAFLPNKIEHFLLHYLIVSIRNSKFAGGPNYLWDCSVALDIYGFDHRNSREWENAAGYTAGH